MGNVDLIITTIQVALLVIAIPAIKIMLSLSDLIRSKEQRELEEAGCLLCSDVVSLFSSGLISRAEARQALADCGALPDAQEDGYKEE